MLLLMQTAVLLITGTRYPLSIDWVVSNVLLLSSATTLYCLAAFSLPALILSRGMRINKKK